MKKTVLIIAFFLSINLIKAQYFDHNFGIKLGIPIVNSINSLGYNFGLVNSFNFKKFFIKPEIIMGGKVAKIDDQSTYMHHITIPANIGLTKNVAPKKYLIIEGGPFIENKISHQSFTNFLSKKEAIYGLNIGFAFKNSFWVTGINYYINMSKNNPYLNEILNNYLNLSVIFRFA